MGLKILPDWQAFHFFYHGSRDRLILGLVRPLVEDLWRDQLIQSFFFIRYSLGGPHVRLRLKPNQGAQDAIRKRVQARAAQFFAEHPSLDSLDEASIRKTNAAVLRNDRDKDERCFEDNSVEELPFQAEIWRYGGDDLLPHSLELFAVSSLSAMAFLETFHEAPAGRRLPAALTVLANQALGLARDTDELLSICRYAQDWSSRYALLIQRGDEAFERSRTAFTELLRARLRHVSRQPAAEEGVGTMLYLASRALSDSIAAAKQSLRYEIQSSHLHMSANRLGIRNTEEVYLGRILIRTIEALHEQAPSPFEDTWHRGAPGDLGALAGESMTSTLSKGP